MAKLKKVTWGQLPYEDLYIQLDVDHLDEDNMDDEELNLNYIEIGKAFVEATRLFHRLNYDIQDLDKRIKDKDIDRDDVFYENDLLVIEYRKSEADRIVYEVPIEIEDSIENRAIRIIYRLLQKGIIYSFNEYNERVYNGALSQYYKKHKQTENQQSELERVFENGIAKNW